jgi:hypothetical protein
MTENIQNKIAVPETYEKDGEGSIDEIGKTLGRGSLEVTLRPIELNILVPDTLAMIWDDFA